MKTFFFLLLNVSTIVLSAQNMSFPEETGMEDGKTKIKHVNLSIKSLKRLRDMERDVILGIVARALYLGLVLII